MLALFLGVACSGERDGNRPVERPPNLILIISDDHDWTHLGFMGHELVETPTIDKLASEGVVFPVSYTMPVCRPSLAGLLTGQHPHQSGVYCNFGVGGLRAPTLLPKLLKEAGYKTFAQGKFWEGKASRLGFTHGFTDGNYKSRGPIRAKQELVLDFLDEVGTDPFFIWYAPSVPHAPLNPPKRYRRLFDPTEIPVPEWIEPDQREAFQRAEATSFAMEAWLDGGIAVLLDGLRSRGLARDTLIVFIIDNGYANGYVAKASPYERGVRTPITLYWPDKIEGGREFAELASYLDIMPTLLDYAGVPVPEGLGGKSLRPIIEGKGVAWRDGLFGAAYVIKATRGGVRPEEDVYALYARTGRWKYILWVKDVREHQNMSQFWIEHSFVPFPNRSRGDEDLYDLKNDPDERNDLFEEPEQRARVARFREQVLEWWMRTGGRAGDEWPFVSR
ncbi:MAG: sulfatase family protein [Planctomycetota bacterium]|jgi:uncharacterized sulfatase